MKEDLVHMNDNGNKKQDEVVVSVNTQMMIGVAIVGVMMYRFNRKLSIIARSQLTLTEGVKYLSDGVMAIDETLNNIPVKVMTAAGDE